MILRLPVDSASKGREYTIRPSWSAKEAAEIGETDPIKCSEEEAQAQLDALLRDAVKMRMEAEVPLGAFLSGGVDTSTVVALMQAQSDRPVKTFTIGFHESRYNEAVYAKAIAEHLVTDHSELYVSAQDALDVIPLLPACYDEPFSDSSQIPTFILSKYVRRHVTVGLSGDGGDIIFLGLSRYKKVPRLLKKNERLPMVLRSLISKLILFFPPTFLSYALSKVLSNPGRSGHKVNKLRKIAGSLDYHDKFELYIKFLSRSKSHVSLIKDVGKISSVLADRDRWANVENFLQWISALDLISFLPDKIMVKVDRAGMGVGLEVRSPLMDHRVVEFALRLPVGMKVKNGRSKWLLRQVLYSYMPQNLIERPKKGFNAPVGLWLKGPLRDWAEALLDEKRLREDGFFHQKLIRKQWDEHLSGKMDWGYYLWDILMFQAWFDEQKR